MSLAKYQFLPWLREGLGNTITDIDTLAQGGTIGGRAKLSLQMNINNQPAGTYLFNWDEIPGKDSERLKDFLKQRFDIDWVITKIEIIEKDKTIKVSFKNNFLFLKLNNEKTELTIEIDDGRNCKLIAKTENDKLNIYAGTKEFMIVGPADVNGFSKDLVIRTEPVDWSTTFSSNLLAHIEFYEEDFPWRYSPARADGDKLRPWISLIVLKEDEFKRNEIVVPLTQIELKVEPLLVLPNYDETWLWAHVQKIESSTLPSDKTVADHIISRLICPRKLEANTRYYAFVIPTFESGRLAGLGKSEDIIKKVKSQDPAWGLTPPQTIFPVHYEWFFRTADEMDFEYLASLLEAKTIDPLVGKKPIECSKPGFGIPDYEDEFTLYMEGALRAPQSMRSVSISKESTANLEDFETRIKQLLDLTNQGTGDPVVTPPFYGQKHIFEKTLSLDKKTWIHQLNCNPAYRAVSGLGTKVFRKYQDLYLHKAWEQLESIVEANKIIDSANTSLAICQLLYEKNIFKLPFEEMIAFAGPVHVKSKVMNANDTISTLFQAFKMSCFNGSVYSGAFRRLTSRRGSFRRKLEQNGSRLDLNTLKKFLIERTSSPFTLLSDNYKILVINRPTDFTPSFDDRRPLDESQDFDHAFKSFAAMLKNPPAKELCEQDIRHSLLENINPSLTITRLLSKTLNMPEANWFNDPLNIKAALAYPDFEDPMVEKLKELSLEWLAPNLHLIPNNSVTIMEPNRKFIEAFMVGVNVAMNQEMRWREYPTDERGSCFRQFWDVKGIKNVYDPAANLAKIVEQFKDISPIHTWKNWNHEIDKEYLDEFGKHNTRSKLQEDQQLVLVIRGDLLKCFPNTTIYAAEAYEETEVDRTKKLSIRPGSKPKFPAFKVEAGADLKFIGFDLTVAEAKGDATNPGWFFVLQETPGEARFGLDISGPVLPTSPEQKLYLFSWDKIPGNDNERLIEFLMQNFSIEWVIAAIISKTDDGKTIMVNSETNFLSLKLNDDKTNVTLEIDDGRTVKFIVKTENGELNIYQKFTWDNASWDLVSGKKISKTETKVTTFEQYLDSTEKNADGSLKRKWGRTSADMAYILYQQPVMIAIHAREMLS
ncbi:MAG: hypothetical protein J5U19_07300 [Candidatus Methanoperedens sp.]|nr:hypothetical protein [Candidatus Methanoperedens sp.]